MGRGGRSFKNRERRAAQRFSGVLSEESTRPSGPSGAVLAIIFLSSLVVSIIFPIILNIALATKLSAVDQFVVGAMIYVVLTVSTQAFHLRRIDSSVGVALDLWRIQNDFDRHLSNIRKSYNELVAGRRTTPEFYQAYFARLIELQETLLNEAVANHDLRVDENHLSTTEMLLACFTGRDDDIFRFVHYFVDNEWMFHTWAQNYTFRLYGLVEQGKLREVRRLFIFQNSGEQDWETSKKLIEFHAANAGYDYRIISEATYRDVVHDFHMRETFRDFGIYGNLYVYRTIAAIPENIEGIFSSSERKVRDYTALFDHCWGRAPIPATVTRGPMLPEELFREKIVPVSLGQVLPPKANEDGRSN